jgi:integrase
MDNSIVRVTTSKPVATRDDWERFDQIVADLKDDVAPTSQRVYEQALNKWAGWCEKNNIHPFDMRRQNVKAFLVQDQVGFNRRKEELCVLRKAMRFSALMYDSDQFKRLYESLKLMKAPKDNATDRERRGRALNPGDANKVLSAWEGEIKKRGFIALRALAVNALIAATGIRRNEAANLKINDIDFERRILTVWHGKRDKKRDVAIVGNFVYKYLNQWIEIIGKDRIYLFPRASKNKIYADEPGDDKSIYRAVKKAEKLTGIKMSTHDWRRTHATSLLQEGFAVSDVQAQLGHENPATTLIYSKAVDAVIRQKKFRLSYGE